MTLILKKSFVIALACVCVGMYGGVKAQGAMAAQTRVSKPLEMSVEASVPGVVMPSPVHVFTTVEKASEYIGFPKLMGDISGDHKIHKVIDTESVDGTKVTFRGGKKMVYLASWVKDGQNHSLEFQHSVTRDMAKSIICNIVEEKTHTK